MTRWEIIKQARRTSGLTQGELADRAGTSQPTISAYERGAKSPTLEVTDRLVQACGWNLALQPRVSFTTHPRPDGHQSTFSVPDRLWRIQTPECFRVIHFIDLIGDSAQIWWDLSDRADRKTVYENAVTNGSQAQLLLYVDGALLIDLWDELDLPEPILQAWTPLINANRNAPWQNDAYIWNAETAYTSYDVIEHAEE